MARKNSSLGAAKIAKQDEFYTRLPDIERELHHYRQHFKGKTVLCNCDDPFESNFFRYFVLNFNQLGLKKLIATSYVSSLIAGSEFNYYFDDSGQMKFTFGNIENKEIQENQERRPYKAIITSVHDATGNGGVEMLDIAELFKTGENELTELEGNGDFRSDECLKLLNESDIICTNPPFSLFNEYVATLMNHHKKFVIIGPQNARHYKEIFPAIKNEQLWIGYNHVNEFITPTGIQKFGNICWYTNLDIRKRHEDLILVKRYDPQKYNKYINFNAIEVGKMNDIPCDYAGYMGVPDNFLDVYNPDQFELIGLSNVNGLLDGVDIIGEQWIRDYKASGGTGHITANMHSLVGYTFDGEPASYFSRIIIRNRHPEQPREV